jgi:phosphatidylglycerol:prolipoprotein diacylglycerol transferase
MGLSGAADINDKYTAVMTYYHPTFLYESLWNLVGFVLINLLYKKKKFDGQIVLMYLAWYGLGRMFIEGLRTDSLMVGVFRISQVVGFLCFVICTALLVYFLIRARRGDKDKEEYVSVYDKLRRHRAKVTDTDVTADTEAASADDLVGETLEKEKE